MAGNKSLNASLKAGNNEFYTRLEDIENELKYYKKHFQGKVVLCNCDDPYESNFFKYFALNFNSFGLKKLIATCYNGSPIAGDELPLLFELEEIEPKKIAYKVEITEVQDYNGDGAVNLADVQWLIQNDKNVLSLLKENGDVVTFGIVDNEMVGFRTNDEAYGENEVAQVFQAGFEMGDKIIRYAIVQVAN